MIQYRTHAQATTAKIAAQPRCKQNAIERLADAICELGGSGEVITEEALLARDFSPSMVARLAPQARAEARRRFVRRG